MLLDTSGLYCYFHKDEPRSDDAVAFFESAGAKLVHDYILAEFVALTNARGLPRPATLQFLTNLVSHPEVDVVWVAEPLFQQAFQLLEARLDKGYSLCDAVSFILMRERGMQKALTTDRHFEQEGFQRLLT
jgi:predicted nucleic acid-binding protein